MSETNGAIILSRKIFAHHLDIKLTPDVSAINNTYVYGGEIEIPGG